jgi:hypothetical protein
MDMTYEKIRKGSNFEKTMKNILALVKYRNRRGLNKPFITIRMAVCEDNRKEIHKFENFWKGIVDAVYIGKADNRRWKNRKGGKSYPCHLLWDQLNVLVDGRVPLCCKDLYKISLCKGCDSLRDGYGWWLRLLESSKIFPLIYLVGRNIYRILLRSGVV